MIEEMRDIVKTANLQETVTDRNPFPYPPLPFGGEGILPIIMCLLSEKIFQRLYMQNNSKGKLIFGNFYSALSRILCTTDVCMQRKTTLSRKLQYGPEKCSIY